MGFITKNRGTDWQGDEKFIEENRTILDRYEHLLPAKINSEDFSEITDLCEQRLESEEDFDGDTFYNENLPLLSSVASCPDELKTWEGPAEPRSPTSPGGTVLNAADVHSLQVWDATRWRLHIDPKHQRHGSRTYDKGGSATEDNFDRANYSTNIMNGEAYLSTVEEPINALIYCNLHARCMNSKPGVPQPSEFRNRHFITVRTGAFGAIDIATLRAKAQAGGQVQEFVGQEDVVKYSNGPSAFFGGGIRTFLQDSPENVEKRVEQYFGNYYAAMQIATNVNDHMTAIAQLYKDLECAHPFKDGNGRANRLLLNELLKRNNLPETIISNPSCAHFMSVEEIVKEIERGQREYLFIAKLPPTSEQDRTAAIYEWEAKNGVQIEFSIQHGERLQSIWEDCYRYEEHANNLMVALTKLDSAADVFPGVVSRHRDDFIEKLQTTKDSLENISKKLRIEYRLNGDAYSNAPNNRRISQLRSEALNRLDALCTQAAVALQKATLNNQVGRTLSQAVV